jgi:hypothetical protein
VTVGGRPVDLWTVEGRTPEYHAYWTAPDGRRWAVHTLGLDQAREHTLGVIMQLNDQADFRDRLVEGVPGPVRWVRTTLELPGGATAVLQVHSAQVPLFAALGARQVTGDPFGLAWWSEKDGLGRLDWVDGHGGGELGSRSLSGEGLSLERAEEIARSLSAVAPEDPRLPS